MIDEMFDATAAVHISAIFAVAIIVIIEIRLGRSASTWIPLLTTLVGYLLPQPKLKTDSANEDDDSITPPSILRGGTRFSVAASSKVTSFKAMALSTWPSILLLISAGVWFMVGGNNDTSPMTQSLSLNTTHRLPQLAFNHCKHMSQVYNNDTRDRCSGREPGKVTPCFQHKPDGIKIKIRVNANTSFQASFEGDTWRRLMYHSVNIIKKLPGYDCSKIYFTLVRKNYLTSCKNAVTFFLADGTSIPLSPSDWADFLTDATLLQLLILRCPELTPI